MKHHPQCRQIVSHFFGDYALCDCGEIIEKIIKIDKDIDKDIDEKGIWWDYLLDQQ